MRVPILALIWEIWRRGRRLAWLCAGLLTVCSLSAWLASDKARVFENFEALYYLSMIISLALVFGIFHNAEFNPRKNWHGFPYRQFTLPVSTWILVGCPMLLGVTTLELVYFAWAYLVFAPMGRTISLWPAWVMAAGLPSYQAIVWGLAGFRVTRLVVLALAGAVFMDIGALPAYSWVLTVPVSKVVTLSSLLLVVLGLSAIIGGWYSVENQRRGGGRGRGEFKARINQVIDALPRRRADFSSPAGAQFWFEWRRSGLPLPASVCAALVLIFLPVSWFTRMDSEAAPFILAWALALPIILASVIGHGFSKPEFWSGDLALAPFLAVRPLAACEIVIVKMKVALLSAVLTWLPVLAFLALWLSKWANTTELRDLRQAGLVLRAPAALYAILLLGLAFFMLLTWRALVVGLCEGLSGNVRRYSAAIILRVAATIFGIWSVFYVKDHFDWGHAAQYTAWLQWALALAVAGKLWLAVYSWRTTNPKRTANYALIWTACTGAVVALALLVCPNVFWLKPLVLMAALLPFPLVRIGFAPGALEQNRHRP
jgi:hypothetical protein